MTAVSSLILHQLVLFLALMVVGGQSTLIGGQDHHHQDLGAKKLPTILLLWK